MLLAMVANMFEYSNPATEKFVNAAFYGVLATGTFLLAALAYREGFCLNRPAITRENSPVRFWVDVGIAACIGCVSLSKLWLVLAP